MRTMYDSVNASRIPVNAQLVAGYINGLYRWTDPNWQRFSGEKVRIQIYIPGHTVFNDGDVLDVEASDALHSAAQQAAAMWVRMRKDSGQLPCIYTSKSTWHLLRFPGCVYWIADPDTPTPHLLTGTVATQYKTEHGYDLSRVVDTWPHRPQPQPQPPSQGHYMIVTLTVPDTDDNGNGYIDLPNTNAALVVNAVPNPHDPADPHGPGYVNVPTFNGATQVDTAARLVFKGGGPHIGLWAVRVYLDV